MSARGSLPIAIDVAPVRARPTGVGVYIARLVQALQALQATDGQAYPLLGVRDEGALRSAANAAPGWTRYESRHYHLWLQWHAARDARRLGAGLVHYTNGAAPLTGRTPYVLTVHDLSVLRHPRLHPPLRVAVAPIIVASILRARALIVPSLATARELDRLLHVRGERVHVVRHGRDLPARPPVGQAERAAILARLGLTGRRFVLTTGTIEPRKNHLRLLAAFQQLARDHDDLVFVVVGEPAWGSQPIMEALKDPALGDRVRLTGWLPDTEVDALAATCSVFAYASLYEGFGLPVVEALALGAPVVTSEISSMPEVAAGAAVLVDPRDVESIAAGLRTALADGAALRERGLASVSGHTWADAAAATAAVYEAVLAQT